MKINVFGESLEYRVNDGVIELLRENGTWGPSAFNDYAAADIARLSASSDVKDRQMSALLAEKFGVEGAVVI